MKEILIWLLELLLSNFRVNKAPLKGELSDEKDLAHILDKYRL